MPASIGGKGGGSHRVRQGKGHPTARSSQWAYDNARDTRRRSRPGETSHMNQEPRAKGNERSNAPRREYGGPRPAHLGNQERGRIAQESSSRGREREQYPVQTENRDDNLRPTRPRQPRSSRHEQQQMQQSHGQPDVYSYRNDGSADRGHRPNRGHDTRNRRQYPTVEYGEGRPAGHMEIPVNDHDRGGRYRKSPEFRARSSSIIDRDFDGDQQENEDMMTDEDEVVSDSEVFVKPQDREEDRRLRAIYGERLRLMSPDDNVDVGVRSKPPRELCIGKERNMPLIMKVQYHRVRPVKKTIRETMWYRYGFRFKKAFTHYSIRSRRRILYTCSQEFEEFRWEWWRWKYVLMSMAEDTKRNNENKKRWREQIRAQLSRERKERERRHRQRVSMQNLRHGKSRDQYRNGHHYPQEDQHLASKSQNHTSHSMNPVPTRRRDTGEVFRDGEIAHNVNRFRVSNSKADETTRSLNTRPTGFMERRAGPGDTSDGDFGQRWPEVAPVPYHRRERQGQPRHGQTHADIDERGSDLLFEFTQQTAGPKPPPSPVLVSKSASRVRLSPVLPSQHQTHAYDLSSRSQKPSSRQRVGGTDEPASLHQSVRSQHVPGASTPRPQYVDSYTRGRSRNRQVDESRKLHASPITPSQQAGQPAPSQRVRDDWIEDPWNPTPLVRPFKRRLEGPEQYESSDGRGRRQAVYSDDRFSMSGALPRGSQPYLTHEIHSQRSPRDSNPNTVRVTGARGGATNQFGYDDKAPYAAASGYHSDGYDSPDRHMENNGVHMRRYGFPVTDAHDDSDYDSERDGYEHTHGVSSSLRHRQDIYPKRARVDDYDFRHSDYGSDQEDYYRQPEYGQHAASHHGSSSRSIQGNRRGFNDEDTPSDEDHSQEHTPQLQSFVRDDTELFNWYARFRRGEGKESSMEPDEREKDSRTGRHRASDVTEPVPYGQIRLGAPVTSDISSGRLGTGNDASSRGKGRVQVYTQPPRVPWPVGRPHLHHNSQGQTNEHEGPDARGNTNAKARGYDGSNTQMRPYFVGTYPRPNVAAAQLRSPSPSSQIQGDYNLPHPRLPKCLPSRMEQQAAKYNVQFPTSLQTLSSDTSWRPTQTQTRFGRTVAVPEGAIQFRREIERDRRREGRRDMLKRAVAERKKRQAEWSARKVQEGQPEQDVRGWNGLDM